MKIGKANVAHRVISQKLREQILLGEIPPGTELPSTVEIAARWKTSKTTAHIALNTLVKEGLLDRNQGAATYVRERPLTLDCIGIYYPSPQIWANEESALIRSLQGFLEAKLAKQSIQVAMFVDRRPESKQRIVLSELRRAIALREIQGLIIPSVNGYNYPALLRLPVPSAALSAGGAPNRVGFNNKKYFNDILPRLAAKGCRSVALISSTQTFTVDPGDSDETSFAPHFLQEAERCGLKVLPEWIRVPTKYVHEKARFGYTEFHHLWSHPQRPDAVIVFPDIVVRGVITAALELGAHLGNKTTFCFHRNAHVDILCPFPAMWTIFDEAMMADALIDIVRLQHAGKPISPVLLPPGFEVSKRTVPVPAPIFKGRSRSQY